MNLTFKGFLRAYCRELTGKQTDSLKKLCESVATESPAAAEAVMVFAAMQGKESYLVNLAKGTWMEGNYRTFSEECKRWPSLEDYLASPQAPDRYAKVWNAYVARKQAIVSDRRIISLMRPKTLEAMANSNITAYRLCKDLGLNLGNVYAYLSKGDVTKVSKRTARKLLERSIELAAAR